MVRAFSVFLTSALFCLASAGDTTAPQQEVTVGNEPDTTAEITLTVEEVAEFNGKDGKPLYVVVDSVIYDFSEVKAWKKGKHHGHTGGADLSMDIKKSPHKKAVLKKRKKIGRLVAAHKQP